MKKLILIYSLLLSLFIPCFAMATCPAIDKIPDYNCNGHLDLTILGDSIGYGIGDSKFKGKGGYSVRISKSLSSYPASVTNFSEPGLHTNILLRKIAKSFNNPKLLDFKEHILNSDIIILDVGRNDRWEFKSPQFAYKNLKRIVKTIKKQSVALGKTEPIVVTAVLLLPNRGSQGPWVKELNKMIIKGNIPSEPSDLRFDLVSKRLLNEDQIHPTSKGYDALASTLMKYLTTTLPANIKKINPDIL